MEPSDFLLHRKNTFLTVAGYCIFFPVSTEFIILVSNTLFILVFLLVSSFR